MNLVRVQGSGFRVQGSEVQGSGFSAASDLKSGQFDQKTDSSVVESDTRV
jgi:hypothetical protein